VFCIGLFALRDLMLHQSHSPARFRLTCLVLLVSTIMLSMLGNRAILFALPALVSAQFIVFIKSRERRHLSLLLFLLLCYGTSFVIQFVHLPFSPSLNQSWLFYLFVVTALNDIGQFVSGKSFGSQKIAQRISPNKTWEGLVGGMLVSTVVSVALGSYLELGGMPFLAALALPLSLGGFAGDLLFSAAKRYFGIKDFSTLIPGHGGMLDRVDSLVITAPLLYFAIDLSRQGVSG
jgi:phosphatidate cytidylyltransferase